MSASMTDSPGGRVLAEYIYHRKMIRRALDVVSVLGAPETLAFPADRDANVTSWVEVAGGPNCKCGLCQ